LNILCRTASLLFAGELLVSRLLEYVVVMRVARSHYLYKLYVILFLKTLSTSEIVDLVSLHGAMEHQMSSWSTIPSMARLSCPFGARGSNKTRARLLWELVYRLVVSQRFNIDYLTFHGQARVHIIPDYVYNGVALKHLLENLQKLSSVLDGPCVRAWFQPFDAAVMASPINYVCVRRAFNDSLESLLRAAPAYRSSITVAHRCRRALSPLEARKKSLGVGVGASRMIVYKSL